MAKDRANDPKRVPPISFPLPSTIKPNREHLRVDRSSIRDRFVPGSQNPKTEMQDLDESYDRKNRLSGLND